MTNPVPFLLQGKNIILVIDGKSHTVSKDTHIAYSKIVDALKAQDWDVLRDLVEPKKVIINFGKGYVAINGSDVTWKGQPFHNALAARMVEMYQEGFPIEPMVQFMENMMENPSKRSVDQLYGFLEKNKLPITEDGHFLAYKRVRSDYLDIHSGTISNHIGAVPTMDRNMVDDDPDSYCSTGLHFCSESYLGSFGSTSDPVMILKINPADVVSIPADYNGAKGRCCRYEVVAQVNGDPKDAFSEVVDSTHVKPVSAEAPDDWPLPTGPAHPSAAWPFGTHDRSNDVADDEADTGVDYDPTSNLDQLYDLVRVRNPELADYEDLTLEEAEAQVKKNIRQKKAQLKIVKAGTDIEV